MTTTGQLKVNNSEVAANTRRGGDIRVTLSPKTVGAHREKIKTKLGLETASELEREALLYVERGH